MTFPVQNIPPKRHIRRSRASHVRLPTLTVYRLSGKKPIVLEKGRNGNDGSALFVSIDFHFFSTGTYMPPDIPFVFDKLLDFSPVIPPVKRKRYPVMTFVFLSMDKSILTSGGGCFRIGCLEAGCIFSEIMRWLELF
ncbi:MAG: hypothetical protein LBG57_09975 [Treponema sp.]|jgi:hypothetical protein|nr:hypothetical protein [Treponema sp.]